MLHAMLMRRIIISYETAYLPSCVTRWCLKLDCNASMSLVAIARKLQSVLHDDTGIAQLVCRHLGMLVCRLRARTRLMDILWALSITQRSGLR